MDRLNCMTIGSGGAAGSLLISRTCMIGHTGYSGKRIGRTPEGLSYVAKWGSLRVAGTYFVGRKRSFLSFLLRVSDVCLMHVDRHSRLCTLLFFHQLTSNQSILHPNSQRGLHRPAGRRVGHWLRGSLPQLGQEPSKRKNTSVCAHMHASSTSN